MSQSGKWPMVRLGEIASVRSGGTPSRKVAANYGKEIPWVKISDMKLPVIESTVESISKQGLENSTAKLLPPGTILVSIFATVGKVSLLSIPAATNQAIAGIELTSKSVTPQFLMQYLRASEKALKNKGRGVAQNNINLSTLKNFHVPLPPLAEQERIAGVLDLVSVLEKQTTDQRRIVETLTQSFVSKHLNDSGPTAPLSSLGIFSGGMTPNKKCSEFWGGSVRWFTTKDLRKPRLTDSIDHVTELATEKTSLRRTRQPSIAFSLRGMSLAHRLPMSQIPEDSTVNQDLKVFTPNEPQDLRVLFRLIEAKAPFLLTKVSSSGHGTKKLDFRHLESLEVPLLSRNESAQLDQALSKIESLEFEMSTKLELLTQLHHSLSTRAFAGEL